MIMSPRLRHILVALMVVLFATAPAWSFQAKAGKDAPSKDPKDLLTDFIHYAKIAHVEMASGNAKALLDSGISNAELATLVDEGKDTPKRFDEAIARAQLVPELEPMAAELAKRVEDGRQDLARDAKRIDEAVGMLVGTMRARLLGEQRLTRAGEYAVPALLKQITEGKDEQLKLESQRVLEKIGRQAVAPLCEALLNLTGVSQRIVCDILGNIKHPNAAPYLYELAMDGKADGQSREAAKRAIAGLGVGDASLSVLYTNLARQYFDGNESLIAFPNEPTNIVWSYSDYSGLSPTPVHTAIFSEIMAMRTSAKAVHLDPANAPALSLFVASDLKRENDLPEGGSDPIYGENKYTPEFYATVFGTQTCLDVLGLAIDKLDTPLVRDAIAALSKSTGGANLFSRGKGRQPLLDALAYPERRVQYEAALTLGRALPQQHFPGDASVVPILASAVRMGNQTMTLLIASDPETRNALSAQSQQMGLAVVGSGGTVAEVQPDIAKSVGVDLIVVRASSAEDAKKTVAALRSIPKTAAAPIAIIAGAADKSILDREYLDDHRVKPILSRAAQEQVNAAIEAVMQSASGGRITEAEAEEYAIKALGALRDIAISRSPAYAIADAESALIDALGTRTGGTRLLVADILALMDTDAAQRKLFDTALAATGDEQVELLMRVADSVRLFGDHAEKRHVDALVQLVSNSSGATAEAAAAVHGALNLPSTDAIKLLPQPVSPSVGAHALNAGR